MLETQWFRCTEGEMPVLACQLFGVGSYRVYFHPWPQKFIHEI